MGSVEVVHSALAPVISPSKVLLSTRELEEEGASAPTLKALFTRQRKLLEYFFNELEYDPIENFCKMCAACRGTIVITGVGKSGFIAQKICMTMVSTGTRAQFLSPTDALHGDIGMLSPGDLLVMFSKSGATEELLRLVPFARAKGATLVSVTNLPLSALEAACDFGVRLPLERELCPFDLAPVTSTALQMLFGDTVAIALMQSRALTKDEYAMNHPAGRIGRRLILRVQHVMLQGRALPLVSPDAALADVLGELSAKGCGCVLVVRELASRALEAAPESAAVEPSSPDSLGPAGLSALTLSAEASQASDFDASGSRHGLLGVFTDGDLRRELQRLGAGVDLVRTPVSAVMTPTPRTVAPDVKALHAMQAMELEPKVTALPVVKEGRLVGMVTLHSLISAGI